MTTFLSKLLLLAALSTASILQAVPSARAHELVPTIADLFVEDGATVTLDFRINLEAFLAGVDLDAVDNTDDDAAGVAYSVLRDLSADALQARVPELLAAWNRVPLAGAGVPLEFSIVQVDIPDGIDIELPRISLLTLSAPLPQDAAAITVTWPDGAGALVLRQQGVPEPFTGYLAGGDTSPPIALGGGGAQTATEAFLGYIPVGFDHILPKGLDHILFVLGLFFLSTRLRPLVWQISAFTLAHTVTLALGALGLVSINPAIVEPLIAASIVFVAVENIFTSGLNPWRPVVIFLFGLLHGLGFASVLGEFGLPEGQFIPALIGFNIGVELGQLTVIAIAFALVGWFARQQWYRARIAIPASCAIAAVGAYWFVERVFL
ncbi:HupE/UreJ family protein [Roseobacter sp. YSTF-M11]|uniref:HupE/UreJ family protein n=1 Tax=Roseobacter insulae TaxID=2859783 RepID=A0A9X1FWH2_9RHOB|nr:HupE/UreJ family protein [Roseobacter insulae]MBW4708851.1 HupE/UreJ family protein [Roseobacter insulae]